MQVSDIVRSKEIVDEEKLIKHLDLGFKYFKENNLLDDRTLITEAAEMIEVDGKWMVDYNAEGPSGRPRTPVEAARDIQVFDNRREANRAVQKFNRTGQRTITATAGEAPGKWRRVGGNRGARNHQLKLQLQGRVARALRWFTPIAAAIGVAQTLETYQNYQIELYMDYRNGFMDEATYEAATRAQVAALLPHLTAQFLAHVAVTRNITRIITLIRAGATAIGAPAGGPIGMALGFLVGQAVGWGVAWFLQKRWVAEAIIQFFYFTPLGDIFGGALETGMDVASDAVGTDVQQALGLNRRGSETDAAIGAPADRGNGSQPAQPGSQGGQGWDAINRALGTN